VREGLVLPSRFTLAGLLAIGVAAILTPWLAGWVPTDHLLELSSFVVAAMLAASLREQERARADRALMPPTFVVVFMALTVLGAGAATAVSLAAALTATMISAPLSRRDFIVDLVVAIAAVQAADQAHQWTARLTPHAFVWPWLAAPMAAAVVAYQLAGGLIVRVLAPLATRTEIDRRWLTRPLTGLPLYVLGAVAAVIFAEVIDRQMWDFAALVAGAMICAYWIYADYLHRLEEAHRRSEVIEFLDQGMSVLDADGRITLWNDALERMLRWSTSQAVGRRLTDLMPALAKTDLPRAIRETLDDREGRILNQLRFASGKETRIVQVKILPVSAGVSLLWHDVTERTQAEHEIRQRGDRLALAAEAANDGLWQWNLQTREFYVSSRWRAMIGLPAHAAIGGPEEWLDRVHPQDIGSLNSALDAHLAGSTQVFQHEHRIRHADGTYRRFMSRGLAVRGAGKKPDRIAGSLTDTTEQAIAQEKLRSVGFQDSLTGTFNRAVFVEGLGRRGGDALARLGGDEFAILLNGLQDDAQANAIAGRIQDALSTPFSISGREVFTTASIGIAFGPAHYTNPEEIMRDADTAMYHAKSRGKARHEIFDADMHARVRDRLSLENDLRRAIATNSFEVHYQPIVLLNSGMCVGFESLVRWTRNGEPISPVTFVPMAEELGLIDQLGTWVLKEACRTFANWKRQYPASGLDYITVNVSSRQLVQQNFSRLIKNTVVETGLQPGDLRVEITETALLDSPGEAAGVLRELRDFGVKVYLDDFGTGYSSLSHLHKLPVDALKIDRSFVNSLLIPGRPAIVESILALARTLNTSVVAEGIESDVQARELVRLGCTHAQGYLFSRPLSSERAEQVVMENRPLGPAAVVAALTVH
jgi:PAS domain S-box-containing protein